MRRIWNLDQLLVHYIEKRHRQTWPISVAQAVIAIRAAMPSCPLSDRVLAERIASLAVKHGHAVSFDLDQLPPPRSPQALPA